MTLIRNAAFVVLAMSFIGMVGTSTLAVYAQQEATSSLSGGFASITTEQTGDKIIITITKEPGSSPSDQNITLPEVPEGPIIIVPDPSGEGNGTVIVPPAGNVTAGGNETAEEPPVVVIPPDGNVTEVQPPTNVTVIDNDTVIVTPPTDNITEIPIVSPPAPAENATEAPPAGAGNVTTEEPATPAAGNETTTPPPDEVIVITPPGPVDCGCPTEPPATGGGTVTPPEEPVAPGNETTVVTPSPGENVTIEAPTNDSGPTLPIDETSQQPVQPGDGDGDIPPEFGGQN
jgi:hypothetical protein